MSQDLDTQDILEHLIPLEGPGVTAESYRMHGRLGRMRPLPSAQRVVFVVDNEGDLVLEVPSEKKRLSGGMQEMH